MNRHVGIAWAILLSLLVMAGTAVAYARYGGPPSCGEQMTKYQSDFYSAHGIASDPDDTERYREIIGCS